MKRYEHYKNSGIPWIGTIPEHWETRKMKFVADYNPPKTKDNFNIVGYAPMECVRNGIINAREIEIEKLSTGLTYFEDGDLVVAKVTPCFENSNIAIATKLKNGCAYGSSELFVFRCKRIVDKYLFYYFQEEKFKNKCCSTMTGTGGLKRVSAEFVRNAYLPLPPLSEQTAIVKFLESKTSQIDSYIANKNSEIQLLNELKQADIANAVTKGLNPNVKMKDSGIPWIGMIPEHWETKKIKYLFTERSQKGFPNEQVLCSTQKYGVIPQSMYDNRVVVVNKGFDGLKLVDVGDFVISLRSFQGGIEYAYYRGVISAAYTILIPSRKINSNYVKFLFKSKPFIELLKTCVTGIREGQNINYDMLRKNELICPPLSEQQQIVEYIDNKVAKTDAFIAELQQEIEYLKEYKQRLISDVVTGKLRIMN